MSRVTATSKSKSNDDDDDDDEQTNKQTHINKQTHTQTSKQASKQTNNISNNNNNDGARQEQAFHKGGQLNEMSMSYVHLEVFWVWRMGSISQHQGACPSDSSQQLQRQQ